MNEYAQKAEEAGIDGFIGKPLKFDAFPQHMRRILQGDPVWEPY